MVAELLADVGRDGLPGEHRLLLTFSTSHAGVVLSEGLRRQYPEEMTIILQHQFEDLEVEEHEGDRAFSVTLRFSGRPERITVPLDALTSFADPAAQIGLGFHTSEPTGSTDLDGAAGGGIAAADAPSSGDVVDLAAFRRRTGSEEP